MLMSTLILALTLAHTRGDGETTPRIDPIRSWNDAALESVRSKRASDADAARLLAMLNVAMYDAINGLDAGCDEHGRSFVLVSPERAPDRADAHAAAAAAAHAVLTASHPDLTGRYDAQLLAELRRPRSHSRVAAGRDWGARVGGRVVTARSNDGSSPAETLPPGTGPGQYAASWGGIQYRNLRPFAVANPADYVSAGPPAPDSLDYAAALAEVQLLGTSSIPEAEKQDIYQYWSLALGTVQPPGEWIKIALAVSTALSLEDRARLLALVSIALSDTVAPTVTTKMVYRHWRPTPAIRQADSDANYHTRADVNWSPRSGGAGTSPEHTSGHSAFSAAAATVLAGFFCNDAIPFSHVTDSAPGGLARHYRSFSEAAAEAGRSRVFGGVHFEFSNQAGLASGRGVGAEVLSKMMLRKRGRTHLGQCPL
jgi:hypothetical protein